MRVHPAVHDRSGGVIGSSVGRGEVPPTSPRPPPPTASAMVASTGLVASPSRGVVAWRRSMPGGAGVIVISRKRTGLQSHDSSIGCAIALGQSGLACVVLGNVAISRFAVLVRLHSEGTRTHKCYPITLRDHEDLNLMSHLNRTGQCVPRRRAAPALSGQGGGDVLPHKRRSERDEHQRSHQQWHRGA